MDATHNFCKLRCVCKLRYVQCRQIDIQHPPLIINIISLNILTTYEHYKSLSSIEAPKKPEENPAAASNDSDEISNIESIRRYLAEKLGFHGEEDEDKVRVCCPANIVKFLQLMMYVLLRF